MALNESCRAGSSFSISDSSRTRRARRAGRTISTLAQDTPLLLLDEPTTYLDLTHQIDVLDLLVDLNAKLGRTIAVVLHDLNLACRYSHHIIAMRQGKIVTQGPPHEVVTSETVKDVFDLPCEVIEDPYSKTPLIIPFGRHASVA